MHLQIAEQIQQKTTRNGHGRLHNCLTAEWPAFYLGSVAPDINAISDIPRADTHFYTLPPLPDNDAIPEMLAAYPQLARPSQMNPSQALFIAAYSAHLLLDLIWLREVVVPFFVEADHLGSREQRRLTHFILLTYLDTLALDSLPDTAVTTLSHAQPQTWLPFAPDSVLIEWRDLLVGQLHPNAPIRTIEIYAGRLRMSTAEFQAALNDAAWMEAHIFNKLPVADIQQIINSAAPRSIELIQNYLVNVHVIPAQAGIHTPGYPPLRV
ncbi:MAG: zinc dependent phospholipase C family protein [Chloroflexi bacterium]|nr:zinc dependent phospholipase C family protein [Chloroflexota bacterium]